MQIDKVFPGVLPEIVTMVQVTPESLREIATRLEEAEKLEPKGKIITFRFTKEIALAYQVEKVKNFS